VLTVYSEAHLRHAPAAELSGGKLVPAVETPDRAERILACVRESGLGEVRAPREHGVGPLERIHSPTFLSFLEGAWREWTEGGRGGDALPEVLPRERSEHPPRSLTARLGHFSFAVDSPITEGTWPAARAAADVALTAAGHVRETGSPAFALCRPPGHHAALDLLGGYCYLNNAAIAAQALLDGGAKRVAILDVDFHHGNGTQAIFYDRPDVFFTSLHGDPDHAFPYFWGHAGETGRGGGEGWTANYPLPPGTGWDRWGNALDHACRRLADIDPDLLVVSLGVDTFREDPISFFTLESSDFRRVGARIGRLRLPTLFVMEGGYSVEAIGLNTVNVLTAFEDAANG